MSNSWTLNVIRLPLPRSPLGEGLPHSDIRLSGRQLSSQTEAITSAIDLLDKGCEISLTDPAGRVWTTDEIRNNRATHADG